LFQLSEEKVCRTAGSGKAIYGEAGNVPVVGRDVVLYDCKPTFSRDA